jgi:2-polyprenyl-3-methyl-5-hydroxy-6-metoxy-1,4-benzoquinol methylase
MMTIKIMVWIMLAVLVVGVMYVIFVALTDGRYFGKRLMNRIYDLIGPGIFSAQSEAERWQALAQHIQLRGDEKILDVGTATGDLPLTIAGMPEFCGEVMGIDRSATMIAVARKKAEEYGIGDRVRFEIVDVRSGLDNEMHEFDVIICLGLLETLSEAEDVLAGFVNGLKSSGVLVLSLYRGWAAVSVALSYDWYAAHLTKFSFQKLEVFPCRGNHDVVIARR